MLGDITIKDFWELMPRPPHWGMKAATVRVTEEQFNNAEVMATITKNTLGRLGCGDCHSGFDLDYLVVRDFVVNPKLEVLPTDPVPWALR